MLLRISSEINAVVNSGNHPHLRETAQALQAKRQQLSNLSLAGPKAGDPEMHHRHLKQLEDEIHRLESALGRQVQALARAKTEVTPKAVLDRLKPDEVLIDFLVFKHVDIKTLVYQEERLIALVVDKTAQPAIQLVDLGELKPVSDLIAAYREQVSHPEKHDEAGLTATSQALHRLLWQPLLAGMANKQRVYLVPDGLLNLLPFSALMGPDGRYIAETMELVMLSTGRDLAVPLSTGQIQAPLILSSPYYDTSQKEPYAGVRQALKRTSGTRMGDLYFSPLPGTAVEGHRINQVWRKRGIDPAYFAYETATEQNLKTVSVPRVLHLATHGFFLDRAPASTDDDSRSSRAKMMDLQPETKRPMPYRQADNPLLRSGLALIGANEGIQSGTESKAKSDDGIFTALEALALDLNGTALVVLSACETGVGSIQQGEGVYELRRAFQEAGAHNVVSTLWTVSDEGTQVFMEAFYTRFLNGEKPQAALRQTQREFMHSPRWNHPCFWAPFVMVGRE